MDGLNEQTSRSKVGSALICKTPTHNPSNITQDVDLRSINYVNSLVQQQNASSIRIHIVDSIQSVQISLKIDTRCVNL